MPSVGPAQRRERMSSGLWPSTSSAPCACDRHVGRTPAHEETLECLSDPASTARTTPGSRIGTHTERHRVHPPSRNDKCANRVRTSALVWSGAGAVPEQHLI